MNYKINVFALLILGLIATNCNQDDSVVPLVVTPDPTDANQNGLKYYGHVKVYDATIDCSSPVNIVVACFDADGRTYNASISVINGGATIDVFGQQLGPGHPTISGNFATLGRVIRVLSDAVNQALVVEESPDGSQRRLSRLTIPTSGPITFTTIASEDFDCDYSLMTQRYSQNGFNCYWLGNYEYEGKAHVASLINGSTIQLSLIPSGIWIVGSSGNYLVTTDGSNTYLCGSTIDPIVGLSFSVALDKSKMPLNVVAAMTITGTSTRILTLSSNGLLCMSNEANTEFTMINQEIGFKVVNFCRDGLVLGDDGKLHTVRVP